MHRADLACVAAPRRSMLRRRRSGEGGQALVEFSLILTPLLFLLLGVVQFGFIFNSYITVSTAAREAAREGSIYVYDRTVALSVNDAARNERIRSSLLASLNGLAKTAPNLTNGTTWTSTSSGTTTTYTNGDITVTYALPGTVTANDTRQGYRVTVRATYHQDLVIPLVSVFLPQDAGGRLPLAGEVTMVIN
ncbi:MAG: pilus assembly protein [Chloroflexi bacterium]|nr:pilus assembly protein [Chloroflexota bacterium]